MSTPLFTRDDLERLIASEVGPHLSLFLPAPVIANDTAEEVGIRFDNLLRSAHASLTRYWMPELEAREFLRPLESLASEVLQLNQRRHNVAIFVCSKTCEVFRIDHPLSEQLTIARAFHFRPLLPCLDEPDPYAVLTLSQQRVALFASTHTGLEPVEDFMPESFEKVEAELMVEPQTQARSTATGGRDKQGVVFHGQGGARDVEKVDLANYLKHVDSSVCSYLRQHMGTSLILAGVDSLTAMYRANSHCDRIVEHTLSGNIDHLSAEELQARVVSVAGDDLHNRRKQKGVRIREHDVLVATDPEQVLVAASEGRIETLFIDRDATLYGIFMADQGTLKEVHRVPSGDPGDSSHDLIELAAVQTIKTGGSVYVVPADDMPVAKRMVAALRF
jgi:Bacterial archaeo-eukaryotic release factor family 7